ncbi:MAG: TrkH family potassium uptake protein [Phycisphaerales bacterium]|nr:MAG: TrkH family potassium uptake protein [Phycisphaerales bacterium]
MSIRYVGAQLGLLILVLSGTIAAVGVGSAVAQVLGNAGEAAASRALLATAVIGIALGFGLWRTGRRAGGQLGRREAMLLVAAGWLVGAALSALPYRLWASVEALGEPADRPFRSFVDCYFEAMSGLTTTGASVLSDVTMVPGSLLLWRALTQWLGGLGIIVLFVAVLPSLGVGGKRVFRIESPGPTPEGVRPKIQETARVLWLIYVGLSLAEVLALKVLGFSWFESVCHTFATLATGGFSTHNTSIGAMHSAAADVVVIMFMLLAGVNFGIYYHLIRKRWRAAYRDPELRLYLGVVFVGFLIVAGHLLTHTIHTTVGEQVRPSIGSAVRYGLFQTVSLQTTTGFCTADFNQWPAAARTVLVLLMFVGASAGSTGGGIKIVRCLITAKVLWGEMERVFRPNVIRVVKIGDTPVDSDLRLATLCYVIIIALLFAGGGIALLVLEQGQDIDVVTAITASAATLNNIGPGLGLVGAVEHYGWFSKPSKLVLSLLMVLGRLEVYAIAVLFLPRFWLRE